MVHIFISATANNGYSGFVDFFKSVFTNIFSPAINFVTSNWLLAGPIIVAFVCAVIAFIWSRFR